MKCNFGNIIFKKYFKERRFFYILVQKAVILEKYGPFHAGESPNLLIRGKFDAKYMLLCIAKSLVTRFTEGGIFDGSLLHLQESHQMY